jgi:hypothetical protein
MAAKLPPYRLIRLIEQFRLWLLTVNRSLFPGSVVLYEQFQYFWLLPALYTAAKLNIAKHLAIRPMTASELAHEIECQPDQLFRLMRALASQGIFRQARDGKFRLNRLSKPLLEGPDSLRAMILHHLGPVNWNLMSHLEKAVLEGKDPFLDLHGKGIYDYLKEHPAEYEIFDRSMSNLSELSLLPILSAHDFSRYPVIADIGGGEGFLLTNLLKHAPQSKGILFDTREALAKALTGATDDVTTKRIRQVEGDFFESVPSGASLYLLKNILHNWPDDACSGILSVIRQQMEPGASVMVIEMVVPDGNEPSLSKMLDIQMMASMDGGRERTRAEFEKIFLLAGFSKPRFIPTIAPLSLILSQKQ